MQSRVCMMQIVSLIKVAVCNYAETVNVSRIVRGMVFLNEFQIIISVFTLLLYPITLKFYHNSSRFLCAFMSHSHSNFGCGTRVISSGTVTLFTMRLLHSWKKIIKMHFEFNQDILEQNYFEDYILT